MNQQGSAEWIQERLGRFTASEIHKLIPSGKGGNKFSETGKTYILEKLVELETGFPHPRFTDRRWIGYRTRTNGP